MTGRKLLFLMLGSLAIAAAIYFFVYKKNTMEVHRDLLLGCYRRSANGILDMLYIQGDGKYSQHLEINGRQFVCKGNFRRVDDAITLERMYLIPAEVYDSSQLNPRLLYLVPLEYKDGSMQYVSEATTITYEYVQ